jgi:hypothetical protein
MQTSVSAIGAMLILPLVALALRFFGAKLITQGIVLFDKL